MLVPFSPMAAFHHGSPMGAKASEAFVKGGIVTVDATLGMLKVATTAAVTQLGVVMETVTAASPDGTTQPLYIPFEDGQTWLADCEGTPTQTMVGTIVSMESNVLVDENDTGNSPYLLITGIHDATKKLIYVQPVMRLITARETA